MAKYASSVLAVLCFLILTGGNLAGAEQFPLSVDFEGDGILEQVTQEDGAIVIRSVDGDTLARFNREYLFVGEEEIEGVVRRGRLQPIRSTDGQTLLLSEIEEDAGGNIGPARYLRFIGYNSGKSGAVSVIPEIYDVPSFPHVAWKIVPASDGKHDLWLRQFCLPAIPEFQFTAAEIELPFEVGPNGIYNLRLAVRQDSHTANFFEAQMEKMAQTTAAAWVEDFQLLLQKSKAPALDDFANGITHTVVLRYAESFRMYGPGRCSSPEKAAEFHWLWRYLFSMPAQSNPTIRPEPFPDWREEAYDPTRSLAGQVPFRLSDRARILLDLQGIAFYGLDGDVPFEVPNQTYAADNRQKYRALAALPPVNESRAIPGDSVGISSVSMRHFGIAGGLIAGLIGAGIFLRKKVAVRNDPQRWYLCVSGTVLGPFFLRELRTEVSRLDDSTDIWVAKEGETEWKRYSEEAG